MQCCQWAWGDRAAPKNKGGVKEGGPKKLGAKKRGVLKSWRLKEGVPKRRGGAKEGRFLKSGGLEEQKGFPPKKKAEGGGAQNDRSKMVVPRSRGLKEGAPPPSKDGGGKRGGAPTAGSTGPCSIRGWGDNLRTCQSSDPTRIPIPTSGPCRSPSPEVPLIAPHSESPPSPSKLRHFFGVTPLLRKCPMGTPTATAPPSIPL